MHLVNSIIHIVQALLNAEQTFLIASLHHLFNQPTNSEPQIETVKSTKAMDARSDHRANPENAWAIWQSLGDDAVSGRLENTSINHDRYLYSDA